MRISGTEPSSVILSYTKLFQNISRNLVKPDDRLDVHTNKRM